MSDREAPKQLSPATDTDLTNFPVVTLSARDVVFRAHSGAHAPGWFNSDGKGRFDLPAPRGTLYVADTIKVAVRERLFGMFDEGNKIAKSLVSGMVVSELSISAPRCADLGADGLDHFGVTRELDTMVPYAIPHEWAQRFSSEKMGGIHYGARSTRGPMNAWAVFGEADEHPVKERSGRLNYIDACAVARLTILGRPTSMSGAAVATPPKKK